MSDLASPLASLTSRASAGTRTLERVGWGTVRVRPWPAGRVTYGFVYVAIAAFLLAVGHSKGAAGFFVVGCAIAASAILAARRVELRGESGIVLHRDVLGRTTTLGPAGEVRVHRVRLRASRGGASRPAQVWSGPGGSVTVNEQEYGLAALHALAAELQITPIDDAADEGGRPAPGGTRRPTPPRATMTRRDQLMLLALLAISTIVMVYNLYGAGR